MNRLGPKARVRVCYEAGPTGYRLARRLNEQGSCCMVVAIAGAYSKKRRARLPFFCPLRTRSASVLDFGLAWHLGRSLMGVSTINVQLNYAWFGRVTANAHLQIPSSIPPVRRYNERLRYEMPFRLRERL